MTPYFTVILVITAALSIITLILIATHFKKQSAASIQLQELQRAAQERDKTLESLMVRLDERARYHQDMADNVLRPAQ